jgi:hypothetical protein
MNLSILGLKSGGQHTVYTKTPYVSVKLIDQTTASAVTEGADTGKFSGTGQ